MHEHRSHRLGLGGLIAFLGLAGVFGPFTAIAQEGKPKGFVLDDLTRVPELTEIALSPGGDRVVFLSSRATDLSPFHMNAEVTLWLGEPGREPRRISTDGRVSKLVWSPDGKSVAFLLRKRPSVPPKPEDFRDSLVVGFIDPSGDSLRETRSVQACEGGPVQSFSWRPSGLGLAVLCGRAPAAPPDKPPATKPVDTEKDIIVASRSRHFDALPSKDEGPSQTLELHEFGSGGSGPVVKVPLAAGGKTLLVTDGLGNARRPIVFASDGRCLWFTATEDPSLYAIFSTHRAIYRSCASPGGKFETSMVPGSEGPVAAPSLSPDGKVLGWVRYGGHFPDRLGAPDLLTLDPRSGVSPGAAGQRPRAVTLDGFILSFHTDPAPVWSPEGHVYIQGVENAGYRLFEADPATGTRKPVTPENQHVSAFSVARDGRSMAVIMGDASSPDEVYLRRGVNGPFVRLTRFGDDVKKAFAVSDVRAISWPSRDGKFEVRGFLVTPSGVPPGTRLPLIVDIHGGPGVYYQNHFQPVHLEGGGDQLPPELLASHGYAVLCPNPRGDAAYTMEYAKPGLGSWDLKIDDVLAGVDALVARGIADPGRLGVSGGSFGGWGAVAAISRSKLFRAAVSHDGPLDLPTEMALEYRRSLLSNWNAFSQILGGVPFDTHLPTIDPTTIRTPLLLRFGARASDPAHPESFYVSGMGVYAYLDCHGVPVEMLVHPNESHGIFDPTTLRDYVDRAVNWFDYWLGDAAVYHDDWRREEFGAWKAHPGGARPCRSDF